MRIRHVKGAEEFLAADPLVVKTPAEFRGHWKETVFRNDSPLFLEIGMGMGTFVRTHARLHSDTNYIGFEINTTVLYKAIKRYRSEWDVACAESNGAAECEPDEAKQRVQKPENRVKAIEEGNLRFIRSDARLLCEDFAKGEVDRIYLNFSDPWPKDKNANKRLTSPVFLKLYDEILCPDGVIEFKTDNRGLFDYSVETLPACGWQILAITYDLHRDEAMNQGNVMTEYERKFSEKGNPIYKLIASRASIR